jgi:predicted transcriptional regulator
MANLALILIEIVSAILCFVLLRFMIKPYRTTGEGRYLGLPLGFGFLGISYIFMGFALYFESFIFVDEIKWLQLFTQAYAFGFLAATYYFSKKPAKNTRLWWNITYAGLLFAAVVSYLVVFEPPIFELPSYKTVDEYFRLFNMVCLTYISIHTLRSHASRPDPKALWFILSYLLLGFGQYSSLIWSLDSSFAAYVGALFLRLSGLLIFLFWSTKLSTVRVKRPQKERLDLRKLPRRDKMRIYGDLLFVLSSESKEEKIVLTRVQLRTNVPYDRLKTYIAELKELGLIEDEASLKLTEKGKLFLREYETVLDSMKRMGLTYR